MANNQSELDRAKNESEPLFAKMLTCYASQLRNNIDDSLLPFSCICKIVHIPGNISKEKYKNIDDLEIKKCIDCAIILDEYYHKDIIAQGRQIDTGKFLRYLLTLNMLVKKICILEIMQSAKNVQLT